MYCDEGLIKVNYDGCGELLQNHQMKAATVAKSIQALDVIFLEAYKESNMILHANISTEVLIEGGFQEGSLWWLIKIIGSSEESQRSIDDKGSFKAISSAIAKVVDVIKKLPGDNLEIVIREGKDGFQVEIDGDLVTLDEVECAILTNDKIRNSLSDLAMPLDDDGVRILQIDNLTNPESSISIDKDSCESFILRRKHKHIVDEGRSSGFFYVETLSYNPKSKWKVVAREDSSFSFSATITDSSFLKRVSDNSEKFSKDDLMEISYTWYMEKSKLTGRVNATYTITEVKNHIPVEDKQWKLV